MLFDEAELPGAAPFLDAAFAGEGVVAGGVGFGPDEQLAAVFLRVAVEGSVAVLEGAAVDWNLPVRDNFRSLKPPSMNLSRSGNFLCRSAFVVINVPNGTFFA